MQLKYESIEILLPCEPFSKKGNVYFDEKSNAFVIPFAFCGSREKCSWGEEYHVHAYRKIRLAAPPIGLHSKVYWELTYCVYKCHNCDCYATQQIPFRFGKTKCTTYLAKMICDDLDSKVIHPHFKWGVAFSGSTALYWVRQRRVSLYHILPTASNGGHLTYSFSNLSDSSCSRM